MGITVRDLLNVEYFRDFKIIAGKRGLHREIQGVTVADAPDGYRWKSEKELCFVGIIYNLSWPFSYSLLVKAIRTCIYFFECTCFCNFRSFNHFFKT